MSGISPRLVKHEEIGFLLIVAQARFPPQGGELEPILVRLEHLLMFADWAAIPLVALVSHEGDAQRGLPKRLGNAFPKHGQYHHVDPSDPAHDESIIRAISRIGRGVWALAGGPFVGPVMDLAASLMRRYTVYLLEDCLFGANSQSVEHLYARNAIPSTLKSLYYELKQDVDGSGLPRSWHERRNEFKDRFVEPEKWPPLR